MNFVDPSMALLAACGGDTVKLFDVSAEPDRDPCTLSYTPTPRSQVNSVKWNHTNLVVVSAGDDNKISLWQKNGQSLGTMPPLGIDSGDNIDESILSISFSNKSSRYICSGGTGQVVKIWDLKGKHCMKRLDGHTDTITGAMYNCKDEHLASISLKGDIIIHSLVYGAKVAQLKDPNGQVLRVLDYSRISRHVLVTAGDDGSVHLWDTTGRGPKVSWLKQHSAPTTGVSFSPSNDKIMASVGLDKKLYTFDSGTRRPPSCYSYEAPFTSLAFRDDGWILAAGTNNGQVVFYDVRAKRDPITALRAYSNSEAVTSLCWQRLKPIVVNENSCTAETALIGGAGEDSILMPDPLPSMKSSALSSVTATSGSRNPTRMGLSGDASSLTTINGGLSTNLYLSAAEETPLRNHLRMGGALPRLQARSSYTNNLIDDMEVFSPLVDVQPITPSLGNPWDNSHNEARRENLSIDKKPTSLLFPSSIRRFPFTEEVGSDPHPVYDWRANSTPRQDDTRSSSSQLGSTPTAHSKSEESFSSTPPEAWGGESLSNSRFGMLTSGGVTSGSTGSGLLDVSSSTSQTNSITNAGSSYPNLRTKDISNQETSLGPAEHARFNAITSSLGTKSITGQYLESSGSPLSLHRRYSTYAERISTTSSFSDGAALASGSPKSKKTGTETREELLNGSTLQPQRETRSPDLQQGTSSFGTQLIERILEEKLTSVQKSIHEDMRNLHIELIRQFHMQETEISSFKSSVVEMLAEMMKEFQALRKENQQLRQLL